MYVHLLISSLFIIIFIRNFIWWNLFVWFYIYQVVTAPMSSMNAIAVEAYKKYVVVSLIHHGQVFVLLDFFKGYPYWHSKTNFMTSKLRVQCNNLILEGEEPVLECWYRHPIQIVACILTKNEHFVFIFFYICTFFPVSRKCLI